ncbi:CPBP family intramembrane glutamic endopeptidase [Synechococcus sp. CC9605]|uniref:CPBP family intramembrane glutamic endopeptidase n=1 Tax=Synechococcus sp. (strain CC9605) TaxID=110662 RepID=UPI00005D5810|nr:type II CAAX endopeptidase family protein [Synechococcus sp. CC9605]ABB34476.1 possible membrane associated protease [Synechococcus sp. CC9605]
MPSSPQPVSPRWKGLLAALSLALAGFIWLSGLIDSLSRPSVAPALSLQQQELTLLAEPAVPPPLREALLGEAPREALRKALEGISAEERTERQQQMFLLLQGQGSASADLERGGDDPLLQQLQCEAGAADPTLCIDAAAAGQAAFRLALSTVLPLVTALLGGVLLLCQAWRLLRGRLMAWPDVQGPELTLVDMALLVAGGFVVISAVGVPLVAFPLVGALTAGLGSPRREAVSVVINYGVMALPSLLILWRQVRSLPRERAPLGGWMQWRVRPLFSALRDAMTGWLMVTPVVMLTGWLLVRLVGDPGGSNPLLELVLGSRDPLALGLLALTAVVLAPLFEETIFRGALLPVLATKLGPLPGVLLSGLLFAMAHISVGELAPLTVLGVGLGLVRLRSGRLWPSVLMHGLWNAVTFLNLLLL